MNLHWSERIRDGGRVYVLTLWWTDAGMVEGMFSVSEIEA